MWADRLCLFRAKPPPCAGLYLYISQPAPENNGDSKKAEEKYARLPLSKQAVGQLCLS